MGVLFVATKQVCLFFKKNKHDTPAIYWLSAKQNQMRRYVEKVYFKKHEDFGYKCKLDAI